MASACSTEAAMDGLISAIEFMVASLFLVEIEKYPCDRGFANANYPSGVDMWAVSTGL